MELRLATFSREVYEGLVRQPPELLTDVQRAARFYFMQRAGFSGLPGRTSFPATPNHNKAIGARQLARLFLAARKRLERVTVEHLTWSECVRRYDRPFTLFYLDPPYWGFEDVYGKAIFERADFERMAEQLAGLKGRFILSLNDVPQIRRIFARFEIGTVATRYTAGSARKARELVITN